MKKNLKLCGALLISTLLVSCGSSEEKTIEKYLPGTYIKQHKKGESIGFGYHKEINIKNLKGKEYRITCIGNDSTSYDRDENSKIIEVKDIRTPDVFDMEISSITLNQKSDSIEKYYIRGFVTNVISNGTTFSAADEGVNNSVSINLIVGKDTVEVNLGADALYSARKK